jgi:hypothetical protein
LQRLVRRVDEQLLEAVRVHVCERV